MRMCKRACVPLHFGDSGAFFYRLALGFCSNNTIASELTRFQSTTSIQLKVACPSPAKCDIVISSETFRSFQTCTLNKSFLSIFVLFLSCQPQSFLFSALVVIGFRLTISLFFGMSYNHLLFSETVFKF